MTISVRFVWGSEGVPFTFSPEQDSCKRKWGTGDTIGMIRKLKSFLGMNKFCVLLQHYNSFPIYVHYYMSYDKLAN